MRCCWWEYSVIDFAAVLLIILPMSALCSWFMGSFQLKQDGLTLHGQAVVEVVTTPGFFFFPFSCNSVRWKGMRGSL